MEPVYQQHRYTPLSTVTVTGAETLLDSGWVASANRDDSTAPPGLSAEQRAFIEEQQKRLREANARLAGSVDRQPFLDAWQEQIDKNGVYPPDAWYRVHPMTIPYAIGLDQNDCAVASNKTADDDDTQTTDKEKKKGHWMAKRISSKHADQYGRQEAAYLEIARFSLDGGCRAVVSAVDRSYDHPRRGSTHRAVIWLVVGLLVVVVIVGTVSLIEHTGLLHRLGTNPINPSVHSV